MKQSRWLFRISETKQRNCICQAVSLQGPLWFPDYLPTESERPFSNRHTPRSDRCNLKLSWLLALWVTVRVCCLPVRFLKTKTLSFYKELMLLTWSMPYGIWNQYASPLILQALRLSLKIQVAQNVLKPTKSWYLKHTHPQMVCINQKTTTRSAHIYPALFPFSTFIFFSFHPSSGQVLYRLRGSSQHHQYLQDHHITNLRKIIFPTRVCTPSIIQKQCFNIDY